VDSYEESRIEVSSIEVSSSADLTGPLPEPLHENEALSRFVAYAGPYLLWGTAAIIAVGAWVLS